MLELTLRDDFKGERFKGPTIDFLADTSLSVLTDNKGTQFDGLPR
jgi:hypothetical protein